jgi:hypothetical protein
MRDLSTRANTRTELAQRESDGVAVTLLWSRETDVLAVSVVDVRGGSFELVLAGNERPLDVFYHPYAYAALRGVVVAAPQEFAVEPAAEAAEAPSRVCPNCKDAMGNTGCDACRQKTRDEVASGLAELASYLDGWARFDSWVRARESGEPSDASGPHADWRAELRLRRGSGRGE